MTRLILPTPKKDYPNAFHLRLSKAIVLTTTTIIEIGSSTASLAMGKVAAHSMPALARTTAWIVPFTRACSARHTCKPEKRNNEEGGSH